MAAPDTPDSANQQYAYPSIPTGENGDVQRENSPELLRWRADILMDEMMLGAVDVTAGKVDDTPSIAADYASPTTEAGAPASKRIEPVREQPDYHRPPADNSTAERAGAQMDGNDEWWHSPFIAEPEQTAADHPFSASSNLNLPTWSAMLASDAGQPSVASESNSPDQSTPQIYADAGAVDDGMLRQPSVMRTADDEAGSPVEGKRAPWRERDDYPDFETSVQRAKRTNLLPRMSAVESTVLLREIDEMRDEIGSVVPETHEWSVRSRHLLSKAETILRHDPDRTAEVEYYLNQVRSILERVRQTYRWSQAYYRQLRLYLSAWIAFAAIIMVGGLLFRQQLAEFYTFAFGASADSFGAQSLGFWLAVPAAGALGAALGALLNMRRYKETDHGFLDRKYSLRGLLLPIMAVVVGVIIFAPFALLLYFFAPSGVMLGVLALLPVVLAFVYGFFQESLFGTQT